MIKIEWISSRFLEEWNDLSGNGPVYYEFRLEYNNWIKFTRGLCKNWMISVAMPMIALECNIMILGKSNLNEY